MSKFIPKKEKQEYGGQVKPKLKIKIQIAEGEGVKDHYLNEYDLAQMISDLNVKIMHLTQQNKAIMDAMSAATKGINIDNGPQLVNSTVPGSPTIKLPKLQSVKSNLDSSHIYPNSIDAPKLES